MSTSETLQAQAAELIRSDDEGLLRWIASIASDPTEARIVAATEVALHLVQWAFAALVAVERSAAQRGAEQVLTTALQRIGGTLAATSGNDLLEVSCVPRRVIGTGYLAARVCQISNSVSPPLVVGDLDEAASSLAAFSGPAIAEQVEGVVREIQVGSLAALCSGAGITGLFTAFLARSAATTLQLPSLVPPDQRSEDATAPATASTVPHVDNRIVGRWESCRLETYSSGQMMFTTVRIFRPDGTLVERDGSSSSVFGTDGYGQQFDLGSSAQQGREKIGRWTADGSILTTILPGDSSMETYT